MRTALGPNASRGNIVGLRLARSPARAVREFDPDGAVFVLYYDGLVCQHRALLAPQPQSEGRGFLEHRDDHRVPVTRIGHHTHRLNPTPLLANALKTHHIAHPWHLPQIVEPRRQFLRRLIVDVEL